MTTTTTTTTETTPAPLAAIVRHLEMQHQHWQDFLAYTEKQHEKHGKACEHRACAAFQREMIDRETQSLATIRELVNAVQEKQSGV